MPPVADPALRPAAGGCPFHPGAAHPLAEDWDPFDAPYQHDPAEALRWSRDEAPVFFAPKLGYWVVTRYDDVKAVFRDNITFSPSVALEKLTPFSPEAEAILRAHGYAMNRTLVNEDEPAHMPRRRALQHSFEPPELAHHAPMVRRLAGEFMDRFIARGEANLVNEMLYEIPLTVALHFLGIPEEDMATLRRYSVAHTVNTWGRPSPEQQRSVAENVGKFWQYAGEVLEKMREDPSGHGWMEYAIRRQTELPDVVTDSYLHSMMMAGLVAAHETTAHASANMFRLLLERRDVWDEIVADPSLIPGAVEECLRYAPSIIAWRRLTTADTTVGGVPIPAGQRLLIVMTSANHDGRHFENPDELDIHRDTASDHLSFGYGSHQCMGRNLARMEMRIFLDEFTRRLPHMELVPGQHLEYLPNVAFRGPDSLKVRWDPARNPAPRAPRDFPIGAPNRRDLSREVVVTERREEAEGVVSLTLEDPRGRPLPAWTPGAHLELAFAGFERKYSMCGDPADRQRWTVAVLREPGSRGGSAAVHEGVHPGTPLRARGPKNHFRLADNAAALVLVAGGIGITPILGMAEHLARQGRPYALHYCGRSRRTMAFLDRAIALGATLHVGDEGGRLDIPALFAAAGDGVVHACGPARLLDALAGAAPRPAALRLERFAVTLLDPAREHAFDVELADTGRTVHVRDDQTVLEALRAAHVEVPSDCEEGICGTCEVRVLAGEIDHRDAVLTATERERGDRMMTCASRARCGTLTLAL